MSSEDRSFEISKFDVKNSHQRDDALFTIWHRFIKPPYTFHGRLSYFTHCVMCQQLRLHKYDARWKEAKAVEAAREEVLKALNKYDDACVALLERAKKN